MPVERWRCEARCWARNEIPLERWICDDRCWAGHEMPQSGTEEDACCQVTAAARCYHGVEPHEGPQDGLEMLKMLDLEVEVCQLWSKACPSASPGHHQNYPFHTVIHLGCKWARMGWAPLPFGVFCLGCLLAVALILTVWEHPVAGGQTERTHMLELWMLMPFKAFIRVKLFTCHSARLCRSVVGPAIADKFLSGFHTGRSGMDFACHGVICQIKISSSSASVQHLTTCICSAPADLSRRHETPEPCPPIHICVLH